MKILVIATGGTFGSLSTKKGLAAIGNFPKNEIIQTIRKSFNNDIELSIIQPFTKLSENMCPFDWEIIANTLINNIQEFDGAIVVQGTDTMSFSAAAISYIENISKKYAVIFTGANLPFYNKNSDATTNFLQATKFLEYAYTNNIVGSFIVFNGHKELRENNNALVHLGTRVKKDMWEDICYRSYYTNKKTFGEVNGLTNVNFQSELYSKMFSKVIQYSNVKPIFTHKFIEAIKIYPGFNPKNIIFNIKSGVKAIILEVYNSGTAPTDNGSLSIVDSVKKAIDSGVLVFAVSQHEGKFGATMDTYESSSILLELGVVPLRDMIWDATIPKLMLAFANFDSNQAVKDYMLCNISGEITI